MSDDTPSDDDVPKKIPRLSAKEQRIAEDDLSDDASQKEAEMIGSGASKKDWKKDAEERETIRAERFKDHFEYVSIFGVYFLSFVFCILTLAWGYHLVAKKTWQILDDNQEDKLQLIITGGFVAGLASSHLKKRLGG